MIYYSQYRIHDLFELQESLLGLSKSNRWVKLADRLPWAKIEKAISVGMPITNHPTLPCI